MYEKLKNKRGSDEWNWYFLRYVPGEKKSKKKPKKKTRKRKNNKKRKTRKRGILSRFLL